VYMRGFDRSGTVDENESRQEKKIEIINFGWFGPKPSKTNSVFPNRLELIFDGFPKPSRTQTPNLYFWAVLNRLDFFPDSYLPFVDSLKPSTNF